MFLSTSNDIYFNLALEQFFIHNISDNFLFLWSNSPCVIIGRNQDVYSECNLLNIEKDRIKIARRKSGGGAVYHDLGVLCFTILKPLNKSRQIETLKIENFNFIISVLSKFGKVCETNGRNDIICNGKKISGSAFQIENDILCHHGTILINTELGKMDRYLTPDAFKLNKHYVNSVKSRVGNLNISKDNLINLLFSTFNEKFGFYNRNISLNAFPINSIYRELSNKKWIFGEKRNFNDSYYVYDENGCTNYRFHVKDNFILDFEIYSDSLNTDFIYSERNRLNKILIEQLKCN